MCPSNHDAFVSYLKDEERGAGFDEAQFAILGAVGTAASALGAWIYKRFLRSVGWRLLFTVTIVLSSALSASQLILVYGWNKRVGISDMWFALGDETINDVMQFLITMPMLVLMSKICPRGVEGSVYALVTSLQMVGGSIGGTFSAYATSGCNISLNNFDGLGKLTTITSLVKLVAILFIPLIPNRPDTARDNTKRSVWGGVLLSSALVFGLGYSVVAASIKVLQQ